ncbi:hypothetical protein BD560DRAFT_490932 [Blakeslea trispora]|nr:hypothetical protein BD560DRAFT_490932 [Blakeslea trispora]
MRNLFLPFVLLTSVLCKITHDDDGNEKVLFINYTIKKDNNQSTQIEIAQRIVEHIQTVTRWEPYPITFTTTKSAHHPRETARKGLSFIEMEDDDSQLELDDDMEDYDDDTNYEDIEDEDDEDYVNDYESLEDIDDDDEDDEDEMDEWDDDDDETTTRKTLKSTEDLLTVTRTKMHVVTALAMLDLVDDTESVTNKEQCSMTVTETITKEAQSNNHQFATMTVTETETETETEKFTTTKTVTKGLFLGNFSFNEEYTTEETTSVEPNSEDHKVEEIVTAMLKATKSNCLANGQPCTFEDPASCCSGVCINQYGTGKCGSI